MGIENYVSIQQFEGGYLVSLNGKTVITTSLNKAMKMIRDHLSTAGDQEAAE